LKPEALATPRWSYPKIRRLSLEQSLRHRLCDAARLTAVGGRTCNGQNTTARSQGTALRPFVNVLARKTSQAGVVPQALAGAPGDLRNDAGTAI